MHKLRNIILIISVANLISTQAFGDEIDSAAFQSKEVGYYCKGKIEREQNGKVKLIITQYLGDKSKALLAISSKENDLNSGVHGPKSATYNVFIACEFEGKISETEVKTLSFGAFAKSFKDEFQIATMKKPITLVEIESLVLNFMLKSDLKGTDKLSSPSDSAPLENEGEK